ncbi:23S rRNA (adenine(1618)-N(6))-methyltransferase RlmF [Vibrio hippocampi]|uniref:Ribosomal RNA large subunit methyltransferase F n=1 Tax=Vibrio hippocampi TaxID=654686 RepID=A0ABM8ZHM9_9VIBR|nr:23S rRNA (adenine(1618)-N(6))-methyltransferase RlmF [Vibrio hippocampi]CAH0525646.1 Ribosomal RNA large subunit methyltransferase F [Vibrio hippocampi]
MQNNPKRRTQSSSKGSNSNSNRKSNKSSKAHKNSESPVAVTKRTSRGLHANNLHQGRYDIDQLCLTLPELKPFITQNPAGQKTINFSDPESVKFLNKALLKQYYAVDYWDIPPGFLCPPVPGRAEYIHRLNDWLLADLAVELGPKQKLKINALDVGVGANCIYPIIGASQYKWNWVGSDIDPISIECAQQIVSNNATLKNKISLRQQTDSELIFRGVIAEDEFFVATTCNPPFHKSLQDAAQGTLRKNSNLAKSRGEERQQDPSQPLNFGGQKAELWCEGGELAFIEKMANESLDYANHVIWFSTLVSKKDNVRPLRKRLEKLGVTQILIQDMAQGQKKSRFVAWSFMDHDQRLKMAQALVLG